MENILAVAVFLAFVGLAWWGIYKLTQAERRKEESERKWEETKRMMTDMYLRLDDMHIKAYDDLQEKK